MRGLASTLLGTRAGAGADAGLSRYPLTIVCCAATAALAPAYVVRWHVGFYPTTLLEAAILFTLAVFAVESWRARAVPSWRGPLTIPTAVFLLAGAISVLDAPARVAALGIYRAYLVEPVLVLLALVTAVHTARQAHAVIAGLFAGGTVLAVANIIDVLLAINSHTFSPAFNPAGSAPVAIYGVANAVALYLVPLIGVATSVAVYERDRRLRIGASVFLAIATLAVILTFSRGGWVALAAVAVAVAVTHRRWKLFLSGLVALGIALALVPAIRHRALAELHVYSGAGVGSRTVLWENSIRMLLERPLLGAGLAGFSARMGKAAFPYGNVLIYPHNIVLNFWSETGLLGLVAIGAIVVMATRISWQGWRAGARWTGHAPLSELGWRPIHLGVLLAMVAILVHGLVDVPYFKNDLALEFWVLVALTYAGSKAVADTSISAATSTRGTRSG